MRFRRIIITVILLSLLAVLWQPGQAQVNTREYFAETGHWVTDDFLIFYHSVPNPLLVFGYPITEAFDDAVPPRRVQYFQKARFELDLSAPAGSRVRLTNLGPLILDRTLIKPYNLPTNTPLCRAFHNGETLYVCYAFLAFYDDHGGQALFGAPITNIVIEGDSYVQYFERARFEYIPDMSSDQWVRLADIGRIQFDLAQRDPVLLAPVPGDEIHGDVIGLVPRAFVARPVIKSSSSQTVYVVVRDQNLRPLPQAQVSCMVSLPNGDIQHVTPVMTDNDGVAKINFNVEQLPVNQVIRVDIQVSFAGLQSSTSAWFRTWW